MFAAFRTAARVQGARRAFATAAPEAGAAHDFIKAREAVAEHAKHSAELWRKITYAVSHSLADLPAPARATRRRGRPRPALPFAPAASKGPAPRVHEGCTRQWQAAACTLSRSIRTTRRPATRTPPLFPLLPAKQN